MTLEEALIGLHSAVIPQPPGPTLGAVQAQLAQTYADWDESTKDTNAMEALSRRLRDLADATQAAVDEMHTARGRFITATRALDNLRLRLLLTGHTFTPPEKS